MLHSSACGIRDQAGSIPRVKPHGPCSQLPAPEKPGQDGLAPSPRGVSGDTEGWIQQAQGWLPSCRTHRLLTSGRAEHAAVWGDGAAIDPLHVARQHLDLPPWGQQKCVTRGEQDSLALLSLPFPSGNSHWAGDSLGKSQGNALLHLPGYTLLPVTGLCPSASNTIPKGPLPTRWVSPPSLMQHRDIPARSYHPCSGPTHARSCPARPTRGWGFHWERSSGP